MSSFFSCWSMSWTPCYYAYRSSLRDDGSF